MYPAVRADGQAGDHHAFDHRMRIVLENQPVFAGAGLALVPVAQNIFRLGRLLGNERPLQPGAESRAATPAQAGILHLIDDAVRAHAQGLLHRLVAVQLQVAIDIGRTQAESFGDDFYFVGMGNQISHDEDLQIDDL